MSKGLNPSELVALVGAHTVATQDHVDPSKSGQGSDQTPGAWDSAFYAQTLDGTAPFTFVSDENIATAPETSALFQEFADDLAAFNSAYVNAWVGPLSRFRPACRPLSHQTLTVHAGI
jgi:manganese peroxidase